MDVTTPVPCGAQKIKILSKNEWIGLRGPLLVDLASWRKGVLESHVARGASGAEERF